jgi:hypothetical protein
MRQLSHTYCVVRQEVAVPDPSRKAVIHILVDIVNDNIILSVGGAPTPENLLASSLTGRIPAHGTSAGSERPER